MKNKWSRPRTLRWQHFSLPRSNHSRYWFVSRLILWFWVLNDASMLSWQDLICESPSKLGPSSNSEGDQSSPYSSAAAQSSLQKHRDCDVQKCCSCTRWMRSTVPLPWCQIAPARVMSCHLIPAVLTFEIRHWPLTNYHEHFTTTNWRLQMEYAWVRMSYRSRYSDQRGDSVSLLFGPLLSP